jgi:hypothetical protein
MLRLVEVMLQPAEHLGIILDPIDLGLEQTFGLLLHGVGVSQPLDQVFARGFHTEPRLSFGPDGKPAGRHDVPKCRLHQIDRPGSSLCASRSRHMAARVPDVDDGRSPGDEARQPKTRTAP